MTIEIYKHLTALSVQVSLIIIFSIGGNSAYAGAKPLNGCIDPGGHPVKTKYNKRLPSFADVSIKKTRTGEQFIIVVNPVHYFLSRETQQWLYFRQCAHIHLNHETIRVKNSEPNLREERKADCWAIEHMLKDKKLRFSKRGISKIQRDIKEIERNRERWKDIFGGPRRRVYTHECIRLKKK